MAINSKAYSLFSLPSLLATSKPHNKPTILSCPNFLKPNLTLKSPRLGISYTKRNTTNHVVISCMVEDTSQLYHEPEESFEPINSTPGATIDLKLPRRSLLAHYTCNVCGVRSQKLINRLAYERGTVFVQCTGCLQYHKLVDNLNLVVEYNFKEEIETSPNTDQL
ncbi:uncharacterized protein [Rutidosis leptorrhynchoides]|uniref:uncharacterized protein n=1 Tax=Rutidosis leptorrhynchoides TaxID=125765 RepID=UPI003A994BC7